LVDWSQVSGERMRCDLIHYAVLCRDATRPENGRRCPRAMRRTATCARTSSSKTHSSRCSGGQMTSRWRQMWRVRRGRTVRLWTQSAAPVCGGLRHQPAEPPRCSHWRNPSYTSRFCSFSWSKVNHSAWVPPPRSGQSFHCFVYCDSGRLHVVLIRPCRHVYLLHRINAVLIRCVFLLHFFYSFSAFGLKLPAANKDSSLVDPQETRPRME